MISHYVLKLVYRVPLFFQTCVCVRGCVLTSQKRVSERVWKAPSSHYAPLPVCLQASLLGADLFEFNLRETLGERQ